MLSPEADADLLVDVQGLQKWTNGCFREETPKGLIYGDFGLGKSHLLRHIEKTQADKVRCVYVALSGFERKSTFTDVHFRVGQPLAALVEELAPRMPTGWCDTSQLSTDARIVFQQLARPDLKLEERASLRAWILGTGPTPTQARKLGLSGRLVEGAGPAEFVRLWREISRLHREVQGKRLVLLMDEGASFQRVGPDGLTSLGQGYRELFDTGNQELGCFAGVNLPEANASHPLGRSEVTSRLSREWVLTLKPLVSIPETISFIHELWRQLAPGRPALLTDEALIWVATNLRFLRARTTFDPRELENQPTPRDLLKLLTHIGQSGWQKDIPPPLTLRMVQGFLAPPLQPPPPVLPSQRPI